MVRTSLTPMWLRIRRDISAVEVPHKEQAVSHWAPQFGVPQQGRVVPITSGCGNRHGLWYSETEAAVIPVVLLNGLHMDLLTDGLTHFELQC